MAKQENIETRGRKSNPRGNILSNGLFESQQELLIATQLKHSRDSATAVLRECIDLIYDERIIQYASSLGDSEQKVLSQIVNWFFDGKEAVQGIDKQAFEKLSTTKKTNHNTNKEK